MTSKERHEARYQRRVNKRKENEKAKLSRLGKYDDVFSYENLYEAFYKCEKSVRWKGSVQSYEATLPTSTFSIYKKMKDRKFKPMGFLEFDLVERGKKRHIRALKIGERCIQRVLCDNYLSEIIAPKLIYDNGASLKGKGVSFSLNRLKCHLSRYFRKYKNNDGYIFQYDFSSYFDNINHEKLLRMFKKLIPDDGIYEVVKEMIICFGEKGLGLGSQVSQIAAILYPTLIDKYFKEVLHVKWYGRYNDDGYMICRTLDEVKLCKDSLFILCKELDIKINEKKLKVSKLSKTFTFLKKRIFMTNTGKIIMKIDKKSAVRARRRLKKLMKKVMDKKEKFNIVDFYTCYKCWYGISKCTKNYYVSQNYRKLFLKLVSSYYEKERVIECLTSQHMVGLRPIYT